MCRGFVENEREKLKIRAFYTDLALSRAKTTSLHPDFLTLHFLPSINGALLEINGSSVRPHSPAFVTLHRVLAAPGLKYGCRERVTVCEGARFEIYAGDLKVLKGVFRKDESDNWKMECKGVVSTKSGVKGAEVAVAAEGLPGVMSEKVEVAGAGVRRRRRCCELEEIPEVRREGESGSGACCCSECSGEGEGEEEAAGEAGGDGEGEAVHWAVDVGIWAVCFGVGCYLVSAPSLKRFRRKRFI